MPYNSLNIAMAQIAPVWLNKKDTLLKVENTVKEAATNGAELVVFGEALLPGYPFWLSLLDGAKFDNTLNKEIHSHYVRNSISIEKGDLNTLCTIAKEKNIAVYLGCMERAQDRGGHSIYCALVYIDANGIIQSVHRKLQPTYEERLTWAPGDGNGLKVHPLKAFTVGGLNCWENWMPLARTALYAQGENLHIAVWPGSNLNTGDITRFIARESRSFVVSVSGFMAKTDFTKDTPHYEKIMAKVPDILANGGSCIASPNGEWLLPPQIGKEGIFYQSIDVNRVYEERQNFDSVGHYSRPDVTKLHINRKRQSIADFED